MEFVIITILILINGIFSMSELALVSSKKYKLEKAKKNGIASAKTALELTENPTRFLSTVQIGITGIGILLGIYSGENITMDVEAFLIDLKYISPYEHTVATVVVLISITYLSIVFGELLPKRVGMTFPEPIALITSKPMLFIARISSPFVWLLTQSNNLLLRIFSINKVQDSTATEDEIKSIIAESAEGGEIDSIEQEIVERVFELGDKKISSIFTYRTDLIYFDIGESWEEVKEKINTEKHSAYIVVENEDLDDVAGIVLLKDLFGVDGNAFSLRNFLKEPVYINEYFSSYKVLEKFKTQQMHYGVVVDEFGSTKGMVTMDDIVNALIGETAQDNEEKFGITQRNENSWLIDGMLTLDEFENYFELELDEELKERYTTVSGIFIYLNNEVPNVGDKVLLEGYSIEVVDKDGQKVDKVMVTKM